MDSVIDSSESSPNSTTPRRMVNGRLLGHTSFTAMTVSIKNLARLTREPPYWSVRILDLGDMKLWPRKPCAKCSSNQSNPALNARAAACMKSVWVRRISSTVISLGA
ncbi:hypothetical protein AN403_5950 [Pseudomonas fluorescens]|uniref:Uncharacterized protein n=1 Tax=Pseudomonas fluorescens TaxID=294 RepID=A0A0P8ZWJ0_PSEFL|nr:hypothetical protein AN403_5950 [Pseudomonas fluorescens]